MSVTDDGSFFGEPLRRWHRISRVNGSRAVMQRWGDLSAIPDGMTKINMLLIVLPIVENFVPQPDFDVVRGLISMTHPPAQQPEPRKLRQFSGKQIGIKTKKISVPVPATTSTDTKTVKQAVRFSSPEVEGLGEEPGQGFEDDSGTRSEESPRDGLGDESEETSEESLEDSTDEELDGNSVEELEDATGEEMEYDPAEGPDLQNTSRTFQINLNRPNTEQKIISESASAQRLQLARIDFLRAFITRSFHCPPKPATDYDSKIVPKKPVGEYGDREAIESLNLDDLFNNIHDPCIEFLRLHINEHTYRLHRSGTPYPYNDRGPVWNNNSSPFDCCIVAARLLRIGLTQADCQSERIHPWISSLDTFDRQCLQMFHEVWGVLTPRESIKRRDTFYKYVVDHYNSSASTSRRSRLSWTNFNPPSLLWQICTFNLSGQFGYFETGRSVCTSCGEGEYRDVQCQSFVELPDLDTEEQPSMQEMLQWHFAAPDPSSYESHEYCTGEGGATRSVARRNHLIIGETLPARLAVRPASKYNNIRGATDDNITFTYTTVQSEDGNDSKRTLVDRTATYRWLGGIYTMEHHCRVYWQGSEYASSNGRLQIYDGMKACGAIVGGMSSNSPGFKVPPMWARGADILFYERLNTDNKVQMLQEVQKMLADLSAEPEGTQGAKNKKRRRTGWFSF